MARFPRSTFIAWLFVAAAAFGQTTVSAATAQDADAHFEALGKRYVEEFGRFSILERSNGGTNTAAHAAATTSRTS